MITGNADGQQAVEKALMSKPVPRGPHPGMAGVPDLPPLAMDDVVARIDAAVNACRALGQEGRMIEETSKMFADHLEKMLHEFHDRISERITEVQKMAGRLGKRTAPPA